MERTLTPTDLLPITERAIALNPQVDGEKVTMPHRLQLYIQSLHEGTGTMIIFSGMALLAFKYTAAVATVLIAAEFMGLPISDPWFDVLVVYVLGRWALTSIVNGMPEPEPESSLWYIWCYRTMHSLAHISTAYFSHKNMWKYISGVRDGGE